MREFRGTGFLRLWVGQSLSGLGDMIFETTLVVWIAAELASGRSWSALAVSGVFVASAIPILLVGPVAGALIDRWRDKRAIVLRANALSALLILLLLPVAGVVPLPGAAAGDLPLSVRLGAVFAVVFLASAVAQFLRPAVGVIYRDLLPEPLWARAAGLGQFSFSLTLLVGPSLAAPLLFAFGPGWALGINAASFAVAYLLTRSVVVPTVEAAGTPGESVGGVWGDLIEGLRFYRRTPVLMTLSVSIVIALSGLGAINALDVFFVTTNLDTPARYYGFLASAQGAGMVIGSLAWGYATDRVGLERPFWGGLIGLGVATVVYSQLTSFVPGLLITFAIGLIVSAVNVAIGPMIQRVTPRELMGRTNATLNPILAVSSLVGQFGGGLLYATVLKDLDVHVLGVAFGPLDTLFAAVGLLSVAAGIYAAGRLHVPPAGAADAVEAAVSRVRAAGEVDRPATR